MEKDLFDRFYMELVSYALLQVEQFETTLVKLLSVSVSTAQVLYFSNHSFKMIKLWYETILLRYVVGNFERSMFSIFKIFNEYLNILEIYFCKTWSNFVVCPPQIDKFPKGYRKWLKAKSECLNLPTVLHHLPPYKSWSAWNQVILATKVSPCVNS